MSTSRRQVTVLLFCVAPKLLPEIVTEDPTTPALGDTLLMDGGITRVKFTPLLASPPTVTTILPVVVPTGTVTPIPVLLQLPAVAAMPLKVTVLPLCVAPKLLPVIVTAAPTGAAAGEMLVMLGATMKFTPLLGQPLTVTTPLPVVAPFGTVTQILVLPQLPTVAAVPLKVTVLPLWLDPKLLPLIDTAVPTGPELGERLVIEACTITVKLTALLANPSTVTRTLPVVAPAGTVAPILLLLQRVTDAVVPLKVTVLPFWLEPKLVPRNRHAGARRTGGYRQTADPRRHGEGHAVTLDATDRHGNIARRRRGNRHRDAAGAPIRRRGGSSVERHDAAALSRAEVAAADRYHGSNWSRRRRKAGDRWEYRSIGQCNLLHCTGCTQTALAGATATTRGEAGLSGIVSSQAASAAIGSTAAIATIRELTDAAVGATLGDVPD